jgi:hypothetical protein
VAASGQGGVEAVYADEDVWLSQKMMGELYGVNVRTVSEHLQNIFADNELEQDAVIRNFRITAADGKSYNTHLLSPALDMLTGIARGFTSQTKRPNSPQTTTRFQNDEYSAARSFAKPNLENSQRCARRRRRDGRSRRAAPGRESKAMSFIRPKDFMRFFEKTTGARFVDALTGRSVLEVLQEEKEKFNYDRWLETQDETTQREYKMGGF